MKYIAIRQEPNGSLYIDKNFFDRFTEEDLEAYRYTKVECPKDCDASDFNEDLTFSIEKYEARKQKERDAVRLVQIKKRMTELGEDIIQVQAGAVIENIDEKLEEFRSLHNEARTIEGKVPRAYNI